MVAPSNKRAILSVCKYTCRTNCQKHQQFDQINCTRKTSKLSFVSAYSVNFKIQCDICFTTFEKKMKESMGMTLKMLYSKIKKTIAIIFCFCASFSSASKLISVCTEEQNIIPDSRLVRFGKIVKNSDFDINKTKLLNTRTQYVLYSKSSEKVTQFYCLQFSALNSPLTVRKSFIFIFCTSIRQNSIVQKTNLGKKPN